MNQLSHWHVLIADTVVIRQTEYFESCACVAVPGLGLHLTTFWLALDSVVIADVMRPRHLCMTTKTARLQVEESERMHLQGQVQLRIFLALFILWSSS